MICHKITTDQFMSYLVQVHVNEIRKHHNQLIVDAHCLLNYDQAKHESGDICCVQALIPLSSLPSEINVITSQVLEKNIQYLSWYRKILR